MSGVLFSLFFWYWLIIGACALYLWGQDTSLREIRNHFSTDSFSARGLAPAWWQSSILGERLFSFRTGIRGSAPEKSVSVKRAVTALTKSFSVLLRCTLPKNCVRRAACPESVRKLYHYGLKPFSKENEFGLYQIFVSMLWLLSSNLPCLSFSHLPTAHVLPGRSLRLGA